MASRSRVDSGMEAAALTEPEECGNSGGHCFLAERDRPRAGAATRVWSGVRLSVRLAVSREMRALSGPAGRTM